MCKDIAKILSGMDIPIPSANILITQPKIKDICAYGEDNFLIGVQLFVQAEKTVKTIKEGNPQLAQLPTFQLLLIILKEDPQSMQTAKDFFELIFPLYQISFEAGVINFSLLKESGKKRIVGRIDANNFADFQEVLQLLFLPKGISQEETEEYNPVNDRAAEIAAKLKAGNEKRQALKSNENNAGSLFGRYTSILALALQMDINIFFNYTPFQLFDIFQRFSKKEAARIYEKIAFMPFADTSKVKEPEDWMGNLY